MDRIDLICDVLEARRPGSPIGASTREALRAMLAGAPAMSTSQLLTVARLLRGSDAWPKAAA